MNSRLKILKGISVESMECLNKDAYIEEEKYDRSCTSRVGIIKSQPVPNCLITHMGLTIQCHLIEAIKLININVVRLVFVG